MTAETEPTGFDVSDSLKLTVHAERDNETSMKTKAIENNNYAYSKCQKGPKFVLQRIGHYPNRDG